MTKLTLEEHKRRVKSNTRMYRSQRRRSVYDIIKFHGVDALSGEVSIPRLLLKGKDVLGATHVGALAMLLETTGDDAIQVIRNKMIGIELKVSCIKVDPSNAYQTKDGTIYVTSPKHLNSKIVGKSKKTSLRSAIVASFCKTKNPQTRDKLTYFVVIEDGPGNRVIDVFVMPGKMVLEKLTGKGIKVSVFLNHGKRIDPVTGPSIGFERWEEELRTILPVR